MRPLAHQCDPAFLDGSDPISVLSQNTFRDPLDLLQAVAVHWNGVAVKVQDLAAEDQDSLARWALGVSPAAGAAGPSGPQSTGGDADNIVAT